MKTVLAVVVNVVHWVLSLTGKISASKPEGCSFESSSARQCACSDHDDIMFEEIERREEKGLY